MGCTVFLLGFWCQSHATDISSIDSSEDRVQNSTIVEPEWTKAEERALMRKLDFRVLFPCCVVYFLAYLDRANLGNVKILQKGLPSSLEESLHLKGNEFNWVSISSHPTWLS